MSDPTNPVDPDAPERMVLQPCPTYGWEHPDRVKYAIGPGRVYVREDVETRHAEEITKLTAERDHADLRAGRAERLREYDQDSLQRLGSWRDTQKHARGYDLNVSFDVVWAETCAKADAGKAAREALSQIAVMGLSNDPAVQARIYQIAVEQAREAVKAYDEGTK